MNGSAFNVGLARAK